MKITSKPILVEFARQHPDTINPIGKWMDIVENNDFKSHSELKVFFPSADYVGNGRYVSISKETNTGLLFWLYLLMGLWM